MTIKRRDLLLGGGGIAAFDVRSQSLADDRSQRDGTIRRQGAGRASGLYQALQLSGSLRLIGRRSGDHLVQRRAQSPQVRVGIDLSFR